MERMDQPPSQLLQGLLQIGLMSCINDTQDGLSLSQIEAASQKCPQRKLTRLSRSQLGQIGQRLDNTVVPIFGAKLEQSIGDFPVLYQA